MGYRHLSIGKREVILKMQACRDSLRTIGAALGRDHQTLGMINVVYQCNKNRLKLRANWFC
jgi:hypothetical protein